MADDDLTARLQWPSDPDSPFSAARGTPTDRARPPVATPAGVGEASPAGGTIDLTDLHEQLAALQRAVVAAGRPVDLGPVVAAVEELRGALAELRHEVAELRAAATSGAELTSLAGAGTELQSLREEMVALRRRISLRGQAPDVTLDDEQVEQVVSAVLDRLQDRPAPARAGRRHR